MSRTAIESALTVGGAALALIGFLMWWYAQWMIHFDGIEIRRQQVENSERWIKEHVR